MVVTHSINGVIIVTIIIMEKLQTLSTLEHKAQKNLPNKRCLQTHLYLK